MPPEGQFPEGGPHEEDTDAGKSAERPRPSLPDPQPSHGDGSVKPQAVHRAGGGVLRLASLVPVLWALVGFAPAPIDSRIQFPGHTNVPRAVQEFAWRVIETRCNYQSYEDQERSFWAYDVKTRKVGTGVVYSISILSELPWKKTAVPATIEMTVVADGAIRLTALTSSFVVCALPPS